MFGSKDGEEQIYECMWAPPGDFCSCPLPSCASGQAPALGRRNERENKGFFFWKQLFLRSILCVGGGWGGEDPLEVVLHSGHLSPLPRCHQGLIRTLGMSKRVSPGQARRLHSLRYAMQS